MGDGRVEWIHVAPAAGRPMESRERVRAMPGLGLEGDRYALGTTRPTIRATGDRDLTLIEGEVMDDLARMGLALEPGATRRNLTTRGIRLNELVGRRFRIGSLECVGVRLAEPCTYMQQRVGKPVLEPLVHRAGLRALIRTDGEIAVGDPIVNLGEVEPVPAGPAATTTAAGL